MIIVSSSVVTLPLSIRKLLNSKKSGYFNSFDWFLNFQKTVAKSMNVNVLFYYDKHIKLPMFFCLLRIEEGYLRKIKSSSNYYTPLYSVFFDRDIYGKININEFLVELKKTLPVWDVMELRPLALEEAELLVKHFNKIGLPAFSFFCFGNWYTEVKGRTYEEYFAGLPSSIRNTVFRKSKKFFKLNGARVEIITSERDLADGIRAYHRVYASSWKDEEPFPEFMPGLIKMAAAQGCLRLGLVYHENKAIAAQVWIVDYKNAYIYKLAYDEEYRHYSVGSILTSKLMEYVIDVDKVEVVDYLCGDEIYKKEWMSNRRERWGVLILNISTIRGYVQYLKEVTKFHLKRLRAVWFL